MRTNTQKTRIPEGSTWRFFFFFSYWKTSWNRKSEVNEWKGREREIYPSIIHCYCRSRKILCSLSNTTTTQVNPSPQTITWINMFVGYEHLRYFKTHSRGLCVYTVHSSSLHRLSVHKKKFMYSTNIVSRCAAFVGAFTEHPKKTISIRFTYMHA